MWLTTEEPCHGIKPLLLPELRKLTLCSEDLSEDLARPDALKLDVLSSIICPKLCKIVLTHTDSAMYEGDTYDFNTGDWPKVDGLLVRLAERARSRLKVELHLLEPLSQRYMAMIDGFLPAFRKVRDFAVVTLDYELYRPFR